MNSLIRKPEKYLLLPAKSRKVCLFTLCVTMLMFAQVVSASTLFQDQDKKKNGAVKNRLDLLEKIEAGKKTSPGDFEILKENVHSDKPFRNDSFLNDIPLIPVPPPGSVQPCPPAPFYYRDHDGHDHVIISERDLQEMHRAISEGVEELRSNLESLRRSEDFIYLHDELLRWNHAIVKELYKMKEDIVKSERQSSKNHSEKIL
jgi:hypothetical protein